MGSLKTEPQTSLFCEVAQGRKKGPFKLCYEIHGNGPNKLMLIMGFTASMRAWDGPLRLFKRSGRYTICVLDNRDCGHSARIGMTYSTRDMALDLLDLLKHLKWTQVFVAGVSMGGMILQRLMQEAETDLIAGVCLMSTHAGRDIPTLRSIRDVLGTIISTAISGPPSIESRCRRATEAMFPRDWLEAPAPTETDFSTNREWVEDSLQLNIQEKGMQDQAARMGQLYAVMTHYLPASELRAIGKRYNSAGVPILVIHGDEDFIIRRSNGTHIAKHLECHFEVFPGGGHMLITQFSPTVHSLMEKVWEESSSFVKSGPSMDELAADMNRSEYQKPTAAESI